MIIPASGADLSRWPVARHSKATRSLKTAALFAYVLDGSLHLRFPDGTVEQLGTGDSIHVAEELPVEWINPLARRSLTLCIADRRPNSSTF